MLLYMVPITGVIGLISALILGIGISKSDPGEGKMVTIANAIRAGAFAFLVKEYQYMLIASVPFGIAIGWIIGMWALVAFVCGALFSITAGFIGMNVATLANNRTAQAALKHGEGRALEVAYSGGAVMGLVVSSLGIIGVSLLFYFFSNFASSTLLADPKTLETLRGVLVGFSVGASFVALFARVGGGIFTKAADVGADLVGKVEAGIPEDDPRNPAVIADNVGDNVGDVAGMGADLYESYVGAIVSALVLSAVVAKDVTTMILMIKLILFLVAGGLLASIIGIIIVKLGARWGKVKPSVGLQLGTAISGILSLGIQLYLSLAIIGDIKYFWASAGGLVAGILIGIVTTYYTSSKPVKYIVKQSEGGAATNIIAGFGVGMESAVIPILLIAGAIVLAFNMAGVFGIALAGVGMLSTLAATLTVDAYGPIADNAGGIAQMSGLDPKVRAITDKLDALGNTTAAMGKGFAIGSAALTALAFFVAYAQNLGLTTLNFLEPAVLAGGFIGVAMPALFSSLTMRAVGSTASLVVEEVRRQFKEKVGLLAGKVKPDYKKTVSIATSGALNQMILPSILMIATPFIVFYVFGDSGVQALGGMLVGATLTGVLLAIFMANAGGAWDNAKKYVEEGFYGGKGSRVHKATVVGDTVGDPLKDTTGPSINILIKLMSVISLLFIPFLLK